jgi:hypothetical protein
VTLAVETNRPPFLVGKSPFHAKGVSYRNFLDYVDAVVSGGRAQLIASLPDEELRAFITQPMLASTWYDALPMVSLCAIAAQLVRQPSLRFSRELARFGVKKDLKGVYRFLLQLSSPQGLLERSARSVTQYFDFVTREVSRESAKSYRLTDSGIPAWAASYYASISEGFLEELLPMTGAREVRQHWEAPERIGDQGGVPLVRLKRQVHWL